jgi:choline-sulfatase
LLNALRQARLEQHTVVVLTADHGDMLGERGLWYKMNFFEPACRIPLIVHAPWRFRSRRVSEPASLVDLLPTLVALAHHDKQPSFAVPIDGSSLVNALEGGTGSGEVRGEYLAEGAIAPIVMIRRSRHKFVHSPVDPDQLYDVVADPEERVNRVAHAPEAATAAAFREEVARRWNLAALHEAVLASQQRRHLVYAALRQGSHRAWDFQPLRDASRSYIRNDQELNDLERMARFPPLG